MEWFNSWMSHLIIFLLAAFLLEMLLPASSLQKYARLVLSFILMLVMIEPLVTLTNGKAEDVWKNAQQAVSFQSVHTSTIESQVDDKKNEIEEGQDAYISKQVSQQLKDQVEDTIRERWGWDIEGIQVEWKEEDASSENMNISLSLLRASAKEKTGTDIEPVTINVSEESKEKEKPTHDIDQEMYEYLEEVWGVDKNQIHVSAVKEGG
ncbi:stage III sporulation protein AF [Alteribacillus persepolensis]|uniref:Stage III sporulation protein AF n=1 Tax=Alteribacillus persepolensis TaxID=568899 RepID=A0A1G8CZR1_9BACI|nr:stage III sporulation protein AF [Alteribacillus persepolensis]SDH51006.1 stage III sporulation protein AF [Alteribacillus persepolensis]